MKFTMSQDGRRRASVNIRYRVDATGVEYAAAALVWARLVDDMHPEPEPEQTALYADELTRTAIEGRLRDLLYANGITVWQHDSDDLWDTALAAAVPRVHELFPDIYEYERTMGIGA